MEEDFWKQIYTEEAAKERIIWGAKNQEEFDAKSSNEAAFIKNNLSLNKQDVLLDYGCGIGRLMKYLANDCKHVIGLDVSNSMIMMGQKYLEKCSNTSLGLVIDCKNLPIESCSIDKIFSYIVLQHINKYKVFFILKELKRLLVPGGKGLFQLPDLLKNKHTFEFYAQNYLDYGESQLCTMHFWTVEEAKTIFKLAGWKITSIIEQETDFWVIAE